MMAFDMRAELMAHLEEDEDKNRFALKVVKPRNMWEFYVL